MTYPATAIPRFQDPITLKLLLIIVWNVIPSITKTMANSATAIVKTAAMNFPKPMTPIVRIAVIAMPAWKPLMRLKNITRKRVNGLTLP